MRRLVERTSLPTAVFVSVFGWFHGWDQGSLPLLLVSIATALLIVPPTWHWYVMPSDAPRVGRAALAGATLAYLILAIPMWLYGVWMTGTRPSGETWGGLGNAFWVLMMLAYLGIGGTVGAALGALIAFIQRRQPHTPPHFEASRLSVLDGAICGAMIATLMNPLGAIVVGLMRAPQDDVNALFLVSWLLMVPAFALIGAWLAPRRNRALASSEAAARSQIAASTRR
jgi:hypothetical protein